MFVRNHHDQPIELTDDGYWLPFWAAWPKFEIPSVTLRPVR